SDVKKSLTARTNRRPVTRSKALGCSLIYASTMAGHRHPPVNPASTLSGGQKRRAHNASPIKLVALLEPTAPEARPAPPSSAVRRPAGDVPDQPGAVVLDHERPRPLVDPEVIRCHPPAGRAVRHCVRLIERRLEAIALRHAEV